MNKLLLICALFVGFGANGQTKPTAPQSERNTNEEILGRQKIVEKDRLLLEQASKYRMPALGSYPSTEKIQVGAHTMNIYNPFVEPITVIISYDNKGKEKGKDRERENITIEPGKSGKLSWNDNCKATIVCGDKGNYDVSRLERNMNYDILKIGHCLGLKPSSRFTVN